MLWCSELPTAGTTWLRRQPLLTLLPCALCTVWPAQCVALLFSCVLCHDCYCWAKPEAPLLTWHLPPRSTHPHVTFTPLMYSSRLCEALLGFQGSHVWQPQTLGACAGSTRPLTDCVPGWCVCCCLCSNRPSQAVGFAILGPIDTTQSQPCAANVWLCAGSG